MDDRTFTPGPTPNTVRAAYLLRGDDKRCEYGKVLMPLTALRRLDCVFEPRRARGLLGEVVSHD